MSVTLIVQEDDNATELPQVSVAENGAAVEISDKSSGPLPLLVRIRLCGALVLENPTASKFR